MCFGLDILTTLLCILQGTHQGYLYALYAVIVHTGDFRSGHYSAYVKANRNRNDDKHSSDQQEWYYVSDEFYTKLSEDEDLYNEACILFFEKQ